METVPDQLTPPNGIQIQIHLTDPTEVGKPLTPTTLQHVDHPGSNWPYRPTRQVLFAYPKPATIPPAARYSDSSVAYRLSLWLAPVLAGHVVGSPFYFANTQGEDCDSRGLGTGLEAIHKKRETTVHSLITTLGPTEYW
jgi:hypothetical protein